MGGRCSSSARGQLQRSGMPCFGSKEPHGMARETEEMVPILDPNVMQMQQQHFEPVPTQEKKKGYSCCCKCCCCLLCCPICTVLIITIVLIALSTFTVYGTTFTFFNYYRPLGEYLVAGRKDNHSLYEWYADITDGDPMIGMGPGPNTEMYYSWRAVKENLEDWGPRINADTMVRGNELGITIMNKVMWPEVGMIGLGLPNGEHAFVRPYLGNVLDKAERPHQECDGSTCWNYAWLRHVFRERFAGLDAFTSDDLKWIITVVLHKIHMNLDITDVEARDFGDFMTMFLVQQVVPPKIAESFLGDFVVERTGVLEFKDAVMEDYRQAIKEKWPDDNWQEQPRNLELLASTMMDSLALAGGVSVPTGLSYMLALLFMKDSPAAISIDDLEDENTLIDYIFETLRRFPPVAGVPRWVTNDDKRTWQHQIPNVGQALADPDYFMDPHRFSIGRPGLNHSNSSLSIGWAEFAIVNNDTSNGNSHNCPAKALSLAVMRAFLQEFRLAGPWRVDDAEISPNMYSPGTSNYRKVRSAVEPEGRLLRA